MLETKTEIKVTRISNRWHARLLLNGEFYDEMSCKNRLDIGYICREMLRWVSKMGYNSIHADSARRRHGSDRRPVDTIR